MKLTTLLQDDTSLNSLNKPKDNNPCFYHVAPSKLDKRIKKEGIRNRFNQKAIYVWRYLQYARFFADLHEEDGEPQTIWIIDASGFDRKVDPETLDMSEWSSRFEENEFGHGYILATSYIPPEKIRGTA